jgi:poly-gamma-glutamate synthesis protein (capsule biosynthesis protein)
MGEDYSYPFKNTVQYFKDDDMTLANLECTFSDRALYPGGDRTFTFRCPTAYVNILLEGSVEYVNTANNHFDDFGQNGIDDTFATLQTAGIPYGEKGESEIYVTASGLKIGIYCEPYNNNIKNTEQIKNSTVEAVKMLKGMGAEYIICVYHWGNEGKYTVFESQSIPAHAAIDAGADLVYGSHPHVLQPIEEYNGGVIMYSLGNWSFGGNTHPSDPDTAFVQVTVKRDLDGTVTTEGYKAVPCCVSSTFPPNFSNVKATDYNDYVPTPYEEGSEHYLRVMSKLDGTWKGGDLDIDYSAFHG